MKDKIIKSLLFVLLIFSAVATPGQVDNLNITYKQITFDNELMTFAIPETWEVDRDFSTATSIAIVSDGDLLEREGNLPLTANQATVLLNFFDEAQLLEDDYISGETLSDQLNSVISSLSETIVDEDGVSLVEFDEAEFFEKTSLTPAYALVTYTFQDADVTLIMWELADGLLGHALIQTAAEEQEQNLSIALNIIYSVRYLGDAYDAITEEAQS